MKMKIDLDQKDIENAIREYIKSHYGSEIEKVNIDIDKGYSDPREYRSPSVSATVTLLDSKSTKKDEYYDRTVGR